MAITSLAGTISTGRFGDACLRLRAHTFGVPRAGRARQLPCGQHTAFDFGAGRVVSAHGVNGDGDHGILPQAKREKSYPKLSTALPL